VNNGAASLVSDLHTQDARVIYVRDGRIRRERPTPDVRCGLELEFDSVFVGDDR
jgi:hypothetical protein